MFEQELQLVVRSPMHTTFLAIRVSMLDRVAAISSEAVGKMSASASHAVDTLTELLGQESRPAIQLNAAKSILLQLGPLSELGELRLPKKPDATAKCPSPVRCY